MAIWTMTGIYSMTCIDVCFIYIISMLINYLVSMCSGERLSMQMKRSTIVDIRRSKGRTSQSQRDV